VTTPPGPRYAGSAYASWPRRAAAALIDLIALGIVVWLIRLVVGGEIVGALLGLLGLALLGWMNGASGRTPGKRLLGIRVVRDADGQVLGGWLGVVRALCHFLDTVALLLGWLWPLWDEKNQTFADKILATVALRV
jgi:uncharacterized RDD family membrane protein YckC